MSNFKIKVVPGLFMLLGSSLVVPAATITGGSTSVDITAATALQGLGFTLGVVPNATLTTAANGDPVATFPITGGTVDASGNAIIDHSGGLSLTEGGRTLNVTNFIINTAAANLTARAGSSSLILFDLSPVGSNYSLRLDPQAASAIQSFFGLAAAPPTTLQIGIATASPVVGAVPEPVSGALLGAGLLVTAAIAAKRRRQS